MSVHNLISDKPPLRSLLTILLNIVLGFVIVGPILGLAISSLFYEGDLLNDFQNPDEHPGVVGAILLTQSVATFVGLILFPLIHIAAIERKRIAPLFPPQQRTVLILVLASLLGLSFIISISPLVEWNMNMTFPDFMKDFETWARQEEDRLKKLTEAMTLFETMGDLLIGLVVIALLPAVGEELVFRGMIQNEFFRGTRNIHFAIWTSAIIFSAIHLQFYGFIPRVLLGALFGYLYFWSGNLLIPMFAHFFNNAFGVVMIYLNHKKITDFDVEDNTAAPMQYVALNVVLTVGLLYYIWKHYNSPHNQSSDAATFQTKD